jgi:hypothetical protein
MGRVLLTALAIGLAASAAQAQTWGPGPAALPAGAQAAVISGDPGKAGPFVMQLKFPAHYVVAPHWHPTDETVTVLAGKLSLGMGDTLDMTTAALGPGSHAVAPAKMHHYAFTGTDGATIEVKSTGPFQVNYLNPKDDPRLTK